MGSYPLKTMRKLRKQFKPLVLKEAIVIHLIQESQFMFLGHKPKKDRIRAREGNINDRYIFL
jgi:hypothetical protein